MRPFAVLLVLAGFTGCAAKVIRPVYTSPEQKIWLVRGEDEVYRCADATAADQPPKPVCVRARLVNDGE